VKKLSRRTYLVGLLALGGSTILAATLRRIYSFRRRNHRKDLTAVLFGNLGEMAPDQLSELGQIYLEQYPEEASLPHLRNLLSYRDQGTSSAKMRSRLLQMIDLDFGQNQMICLKGWLLSKTEGRLCALWYLF
jgi:hypothetical protein